MTTNNTIKFNVGGRPFEVSRDLMEEHSETMLGKLVSDAWQEDPEEPVFIDRDGDIFAHVLNYLRYGSIELPLTIPKSSFERDLDFYGLVPQEGEIKSNISIAEKLVALKAAKREHDMFLLAIETNQQYAFKKEETSELVRISLNKACSELAACPGKCFAPVEWKIFVDYLDVYFGLKTNINHNNPLYIEQFYVLRK